MLLPVAWRATITLLRVGLVQGRFVTLLHSIDNTYRKCASGIPGSLGLST